MDIAVELSQKIGRKIPKCFKDRTLKDLDFETMIRQSFLSVDVSQRDIEMILLTLERDVAFLEENKFMDYSLLLGVEKVNSDFTMLGASANNNILVQTILNDQS